MFKDDKSYRENIKQRKGIRSFRVGKSALISSLVFREALPVENNLICLNHSYFSQ